MEIWSGLSSITTVEMFMQLWKNFWNNRWNNLWRKQLKNFRRYFWLSRLNSAKSFKWNPHGMPEGNLENTLKTFWIDPLLKFLIKNPWNTVEVSGNIPKRIPQETSVIICSRIRKQNFRSYSSTVEISRDITEETP